LAFAASEAHGFRFTSTLASLNVSTNRSRSSALGNGLSICRSLRRSGIVFVRSKRSRETFRQQNKEPARRFHAAGDGFGGRPEAPEHIAAHGPVDGPSRILRDKKTVERLVGLRGIRIGRCGGDEEWRAQRMQMCDRRPGLRPASAPRLRFRGCPARDRPTAFPERIRTSHRFPSRHAPDRDARAASPGSIAGTPLAESSAPCAISVRPMGV
jgi:hypothetical protein